eukprot:COSAG02_NODE_6109_length_3791_cov_241.041441_5_plen_79_part_00
MECVSAPFLCAPAVYSIYLSIYLFISLLASLSTLSRCWRHTCVGMSRQPQAPRRQDVHDFLCQQLLWTQWQSWFGDGF